MFLDSIKVIEISPCLADEGKFKVTTRASVVLDEILPYLNAVLDNADYQHNANVLTFKKGIIGFTLMGNSINVTKFLNNSELYEVLDWIHELINSTYEQKENIKPNFEGRKKIAVLHILKLLPKTNCKKCGEATCMAFAAKIKALEAQISECPLLLEEGYHDARNELVRILEEVRA